jgi:hypothetical protein
MSQARTVTHFQEVRISKVETNSKQQGACKMRGNHPVPRLNQSLILPKRAMRDKRFADRIAV